MPGSNVTTIPLSSPNSNPTRITVGPDGKLWFTETGPADTSEPTPVRNSVASIAPGDAAPAEFPLPTLDSDPAGIALGPDGNVWFTETAADDVRSITAGGTLSAPFPVPTMNGMPSSIVTGPDGNLWFAETAANKIAMMTPAGVVTEFTLPTPNSGPADLVVGNDGKLWFSEGLTGKIGRIFIKTTGSHNPGDFDAEWATPTTNSEPAGITVGPDCNTWFTEMNSGYVGRIDESGMITEFTLPTPNSQPLGITLGPDGNLWIAESAANQIAKLTPPTGSPTTCSTLSLPPVAKCQNVTVSTATGTCKSPATVSIDNGSTDPNGQTLTSLLAPPAPYNLGTTAVGLTVSDSFATSACYATVQVKDTENPVITCPAPDYGAVHLTCRRRSHADCDCHRQLPQSRHAKLRWFGSSVQAGDDHHSMQRHRRFRQHQYVQHERRGDGYHAAGDFRGDGQSCSAGSEFPEGQRRGCDRG